MRVTETSVGLPVPKLRTCEFVTDVHKEPGESISVVLEESIQMVEYTEGIQVRQTVERYSSSRRAVD